MNPVAGLDVSHHQGAGIEWRKVFAAGYRFAYVKATEGLGYVDPLHDHNVAGALGAGLVVGSYHYAKPADSPRPQAQHFAKTIGSQLGSGCLPPVLDLEETGGLSPAALRAWMSAFLSELENRSAREPILYTGLAFWREQLDSYALHPLWLARYNTTVGVGGWLIWQKSDDTHVPGVGACDVDVFDGDLAALHKLARKPQAFAHPTGGLPDMVIIYAKGRATVLVAGLAHRELPDNAAVDAYKAAGVPVKQLTAEEFDAVVKVSS